MRKNYFFTKVRLGLDSRHSKISKFVEVTTHHMHDPYNYSNILGHLPKAFLRPHEQEEVTAFVVLLLRHLQIWPFWKTGSPCQSCGHLQVSAF
jgi:hypothetical protein